jgi:hypothetical protein
MPQNIDPNQSNTDNLQALREALEQQRKYERENWPFVGEHNEPTGTGASITSPVSTAGRLGMY